MYAHTCVYIYKYTHIYLFTYLLTYLFAYLFIYIHVYIAYIYICIYLHIFYSLHPIIEAQSDKYVIVFGTGQAIFMFVEYFCHAYVHMNHLRVLIKYRF